MKAIIIGAGEVGFHTAAVLTAERHDVVVIDKSVQSLGRAEEHFDLMTIQGSGASPRVLDRAGLDRSRDGHLQNLSETAVL